MEVKRLFLRKYTDYRSVIYDRVLIAVHYHSAFAMKNVQPEQKQCTLHSDHRKPVVSGEREPPNKDKLYLVLSKLLNALILNTHTYLYIIVIE